MASLFQESSGGSLFSATNEKPASNVSFPDGTLRASPVMASKWDPNANQYAPVGPAILLLNRSNGLLSIILITQTKQILTKIDCNETVIWELQNKVYGSSLDYTNTRWLFLFQNQTEASLVSSLILYYKMKDDEYTKIAEVIDPKTDIELKATFYDLTSDKITNPCEGEISNRINEIAKEIPGCSFIARIPGGRVSFVTPVFKEETAPADKEKPKTEVKEEKEKPKEQVKPEKQKIIYPTDPISMKNAIDGLESLEKEVNKIFESFTSELQQLHRPKAKYDYISMDDESILDGVMRLVEDSKRQEAELARSTDEIDRLIYESTAQDAQMEARQAVGRIITQIDSENGKAATLQSQLDYLQNELVGIVDEIEKTEKGEKTNANVGTDNTDLEMQIEDLETQIKYFQKTKRELETQVNRLKAENKENDKPIVTLQEAQEFKNKSIAELQNSVKDLIKNALESLSEAFFDKETVTKSDVIEALQKALQ
ncbi:hypothetical protein TVAG_378060 [Trichomonas vaginalis G3]|uniref:Uncharacterized protein n=1 Tax=Trichomonas vaginalis (strain ATCC PRA-98 / G3) TaxID=412133 RepID=A2DAZ7_TRIV3|nr:hypothetical protein TVAGG3_0518080 [Trichomonas vaginalis G3]EAY22327.1 hypothetical protein TVAG_378060 [Trichomonas vaginalis G3]KAI5518267.1 hypothetical protein TVAGG3_0518080 [Trichomonas vaginalis G3]|eukprot:XP_001583313.1 hypothetical protein [Trichomonas vaginalis G3]